MYQTGEILYSCHIQGAFSLNFVFAISHYDCPFSWTPGPRVFKIWGLGGGLQADSKYPSKFAVSATLDYEPLRPFQLMYHEPSFIHMRMWRVYAFSKGEGYFIPKFLFRNRYYWETNWIIEAEQLRCLTKFLQRVWQFTLMTYLLRKTWEK